MSQITSLSSKPDLSMCKWFDTVDIFVTPTLIPSTYSLNFSFKMLFNQDPHAPDYQQHPTGIISIGSADSYQKLDNPSGKPTTFDIGSGAYTDTVNVQFNKTELEKLWYIIVDIDGAMYSRVVSFASDLQIYPYNANDLSSQFPELSHEAYKDRPNTGVCFSGGGSRALVMAMGQMRYLHQYRKNIKYISSVSGGSWASVIYTYAKASSIDTLLGEAITTRSDYKEQLNKKTVPQMAIGASIPEGSDGGGMLVAIIINLLRSLMRLNAKDYQVLQNTFPSIDKEAIGNLIKLNEAVPHQLTINFDKFWIESVGMNFFGPNGIYSFFNNRTDYFTLDETSLAKLQASSGSFKLQIDNPITLFRKVTMYNDASDEMIYPPYLIMNSLMLRPNSAPIDSKAPYVGYEYTPLYHGPAHNGNWPKGPFIGNGNAPMHTYGAYKTTAVKDNTTIVNFQSNIDAPSLAVASGTSSSAYAGATSSNNLISVVGLIKEIFELESNGALETASIISGLNQVSIVSNNGQRTLLNEEAAIFEYIKAGVKLVLTIVNSIWPSFSGNVEAFINKLNKVTNFDALTPRANYFNVKDASFINRPATFNTLFNYGDAGLSDNFGLMALLRRKVENIVVFVNTAEALSVDYDGITKVTNEMDTAVAAFFGMAAAERGADGVDLTNLQVFDEKYFPEFVQEFQNSRDTGMIANISIPLKGNAFWGVAPTTEKVNILWVYNNLPEKWTEHIGNDVLTVIQKDDEAFPFVSTMGGTITGSKPLVVNMLSNLSYWSLANNHDELSKIIPTT